MPFFLHCLSLRHQVFLDCKVTTEKELDTVEVLKAIQKAKEVKDRKSGGGGGGGSKKVHSAGVQSVSHCMSYVEYNRIDVLY